MDATKIRCHSGGVTMVYYMNDFANYYSHKRQTHSNKTPRICMFTASVYQTMVESNQINYQISNIK